MAVNPRPASTIALMDQSNRVYLTKRPETMKFMGGFYVFPGGAVEKSDLPTEDRSIIYNRRNVSFDIRHYVAAARELFEEVGVLLCHTEDGSPVQMSDETKSDYRLQLILGNITFQQILEKEGVRLDLGDLSYFGHLITPEMAPIRFDTRFFLAKLPEGQCPEPDQTEIDDAYWIFPDDALADHQSGKIPLAPPTIQALRTISNYVNGGPLRMPEQLDEDLFKSLRF